MAAPRLSVKLTTTNLMIGVAFVFVALALFTWLLPMVLPPSAVYTIAGAAIGILFWFLFMLSRQSAE